VVSKRFISFLLGWFEPSHDDVRLRQLPMSNDRAALTPPRTRSPGSAVWFLDTRLDSG
jgi:hypothetical protein